MLRLQVMTYEYKIWHDNKLLLCRYNFLHQVVELQCHQMFVNISFGIIFLIIKLIEHLKELHSSVEYYLPHKNTYLVA
jgi:hypothetical protein